MSGPSHYDYPSPFDPDPLDDGWEDEKTDDDLSTDEDADTEEESEE